MPSAKGPVEPDREAADAPAFFAGGVAALAFDPAVMG
jgi:hypothetical protein